FFNQGRTGSFHRDAGQHSSRRVSRHPCDPAIFLRGGSRREKQHAERSETQGQAIRSHHGFLPTSPTSQRRKSNRPYHRLSCLSKVKRRVGETARLGLARTCFIVKALPRRPRRGTHAGRRTPKEYLP